MSVTTTWGYTLTGVNTLPDMITTQEFNNFTANKYANDGRVSSDIKAAQSAVRNYCGWHVSPSAACELSTTFFDKCVSVVDRMLMIQLPATFVSSITSITIDGVEYDETYVLMPNGILRVYGLSWSHMKMWTPIVVKYTAGIQDNAADGIKELIAHRVTHALESSAGVQSETAGGVSITYNAAWINGSRATALADDNKEVLNPYRLQGVF